MKKLVTILLVAMLAVSCIFALTACDKTPLENPDVDGYLLMGGAPGWDTSPSEEMIMSGSHKLNPEHERVFEAISASDKRVKSIKKELADVKYLYVTEFTFDYADIPASVTTREEASAIAKNDWATEKQFAITEGGELKYYDNNATIKVTMLKYSELGDTAEYATTWIPSPESAAVKSLTPTTLYMPPHSEAPAWEGSGDHNDNPILIGAAGKYTIVFAVFNDGTFGLGAIAQ